MSAVVLRPVLSILLQKAENIDGSGKNCGEEPLTNNGLASTMLLWLKINGNFTTPKYIQVTQSNPKRGANQEQTVIDFDSPQERVSGACLGGQTRLRTSQRPYSWITSYFLRLCDCFQNRNHGLHVDLNMSLRHKSIHT